MSSVYVLEPATSGRVVFRTSVGNVEVELWAKEAPRAARHFLNKAMTGAYDGTPFHRVLPGLWVQGGRLQRPSPPLRPPEQHSRLRFRYRGVLAVADTGEGPGDADQFFFTLAAAPHLDGVHTVLGKVVGDSIYNLLRIADLELLPASEEPVDPAIVQQVEVIDQPFSDLAGLTRPRLETTRGQETTKKITAVARNRNLLSFQRDTEEDEEEEEDWQPQNARMTSSHDALNDPRLIKQSLKRENPTKTDGVGDSGGQGDTVQKTPDIRPGAIKDLAAAAVEEKKALQAEVAAQTRALVKPLLSNPTASSELNARNDSKTKWIVGRKRARREHSSESDTMRQLQAFSSRLGAAGIADENKDADWKSGPLQFPKELGAGAGNDDDYSVVDSRMKHGKGNGRKQRR